ncbi:MAG: hypothetical protein PUE13_08965 [Clostridiales bacterium]|nr:hypothetical protein [Clostridiales bacterium]
MLEPILKGLIEWLYGMMVDIMAYMSGELIGVMSMDLAYFERTAPVIRDIVTVLTALGWALLIGNLVFQMIKAMMSGVGFEAEDPKITCIRTMVFAFLLLVSRDICEVGLGITGKVIELLKLPDSINIVTPDESMFSLGAGAKWLLVIIVGVVLMVQMLKLLFEIGERYVVCGVLTFFAPLAFSMGGSKNTNDIFMGWCRMYCSMLVMMIMNIVFLKLIMSAMAQMSSGGVLIWLVFVVALTRVARKIDSHIGKIGLNPAQTGNALGSRLPGMITMAAVRVMSGTVRKSLAGSRGANGRNAGNGRNPGSGYRPGAGGRAGRNAQNSTNSVKNTAQSGTYNTPQGSANTTVKTGKGAESVERVSTSNESYRTTRPPIPRETAREKNSDMIRNGEQYRSVSEHTTGRDTPKNISSHHGDVNMRVRDTDSRNRTGDNVNMSTGGKSISGSVNVNGENIENQGYSDNAHGSTNAAEYIRESRRENSARWNTEKINHEYVNGRYDPAAKNKKTQNRSYKKFDRKANEERGGRDRKHKR